MIDMIWICIKWIIAFGLAVGVLALFWYALMFIGLMLKGVLTSPFTMWKDAKETGTVKQTVGLFVIAASCLIVLVIYLINP